MTTDLLQAGQADLTSSGVERLSKFANLISAQPLRRVNFYTAAFLFGARARCFHYRGPSGNFGQHEGGELLGRIG